jgi:hypothetical protein
MATYIAEIKRGTERNVYSDFPLHPLKRPKAEVRGTYFSFYNFP